MNRQSGQYPVRAPAKCRAPVAQASPDLIGTVSQVSQPAIRAANHGPPTWKSATRQAWKPALLGKRAPREGPHESFSHRWGRLIPGHFLCGQDQADLAWLTG